MEAERAKYVAPRLQEEMAAVLADNQLNQQQMDELRERTAKMQREAEKKAA